MMACVKQAGETKIRRTIDDCAGISVWRHRMKPCSPLQCLTQTNCAFW